MKKLFCILTVITLLFCILAPVTTSAQNTPELPENTPLFLESAIKGGLMEYTDDVALKLEIYDRLYSATMNSDEYVNVYDLKLEYNDINVQKIYQPYYYACNTPILYGILDTAMKYTITTPYNSSVSYISKIKLTYYSTDSNVVNNKVNTIKNSVEKITKKVPEDISDIAKMLWVHDYLAVNYKYDERVDDGITPDSEIYHSTYDLITQKTGVCSAYAHTFTAIMTELGIPATSVYSDEGNHQWNIVLLDGKYYHIDCTWGDPVPDSYGTAYHDFFLLSDSQLDINDAKSTKAGSHINDYTMESRYFGLNISCTDTKYDSGYIWNSSKNGFIYYNGEFYNIADTSKFTVDEEGYVLLDKTDSKAVLYKTTNFKDIQVLDNLTSALYLSNTSIHIGYYSGFEIIGTQLYYNNAHTIKYYDISNNQKGDVLKKEDVNIFSFHYLGKGEFSYTTHNHTGGSYTNVQNTITLTDKGHIYDSTSDSYNLDLIAMRKYLLGNHDDNICLVKGDLSGDDSVVNILDFVALKKLAAQ